MSARVEFTLSMPGVASWNGRWSGEGRHYAIVRSVGAKGMSTLALADGRGRWSYAFGDGWHAAVEARVLAKSERAGRSDGFCGYDWMVASIIATGKIAADRSAPTDIEPDHAAATGPECAACEPERYECQDPDCTGGCSDCRAERRNRREEARAERGEP